MVTDTKTVISDWYQNGDWYQDDACCTCRYDFFLISQSVRQGTVGPTHYNILADTTGMQPDHFQRLSYKLTHMYFNWQVCCGSFGREMKKVWLKWSLTELFLTVAYSTVLTNPSPVLPRTVCMSMANA